MTAYSGPSKLQPWAASCLALRHRRSSFLRPNPDLLQIRSKLAALVFVGEAAVGDRAGVGALLHVGLVDEAAVRRIQANTELCEGSSDFSKVSLPTES